MGLNALFPDVVLESVSESLGYEDKLLLSATFRVPQSQSAFVDVGGCELKNTSGLILFVFSPSFFSLLKKLIIALGS